MSVPDENQKYNVLVYSDEKDYEQLNKLIWPLLPHKDVVLKNVSDVPDLENLARHSVLIFIGIVDENDKKCEVAEILSRSKSVVCHVIALSSKANFDKRIDIMAHGFDAIFNLEFLHSPSMQKVIHNRVEKGTVRLENRIQQEEYQRFRASLAASPDAFIVFDENRKLFFVSEHYKKAYARFADQFVRGLDVMDAFEMLYGENGVSIDDERYQKMKKFWEALDGEEEFSLNDGRSWRVKAAKLDNGLGTIVTTTDITNYIHQKDKLEKQSQSLETSLEKEKEAGQIQKQFIDMVSHEFKTPLTIIDGNTQLLSNRYKSLSQKDILEKLRIIRSAVSRLVVMLDGVLSSSMLETGKLTLQPADMDVKELVEDIVTEHQDLSRQHNIILKECNVPETVMMDRKAVSLVLSNLLSNAIKFTKEQPEISVHVTHEGGYICFGVKDNGIGIPKNEIDKVFNRYYRATAASGISGSGIGLSLVKNLVDLHEGEIEISSEAGKGTEIRACLRVFS